MNIKNLHDLSNLRLHSFYGWHKQTITNESKKPLKWEVGWEIHC